eukprot:scaffold5944_cov101-Amphora_coffeaeformis.AAC.7
MCPDPVLIAIPFLPQHGIGNGRETHLQPTMLFHALDIFRSLLDARSELEGWDELTHVAARGCPHVASRIWYCCYIKGEYGSAGMVCNVIQKKKKKAIRIVRTNGKGDKLQGTDVALIHVEFQTIGMQYSIRYRSTKVYIFSRVVKSSFAVHIHHLGIIIVDLRRFLTMIVQGL